MAVAYTPGEGPPPAVLVSSNKELSVDPALESVAWRAWPPIYTSHLLVSVALLKGRSMAGVDPHSRLVLAVTVIHRERTKDAENPSPAILAALKAGAAAWQAEARQDALVQTLRTAVAQLPAGRVAVLPPTPASAAMSIANRAGMTKDMVTLSAGDLVDPARFSANQFRAAIYADGEQYIQTVHTTGDAADALVKYVKDGGFLALLADQPWPLFYAVAPDGTEHPEALTGRLGLPLANTIETMPDDKPTIALVPGQDVLQGVPATVAYPTSDPRLRSIDRTKLPPGAHYTPIYVVRGADGKDYGDAAGLIELPGGGRILYIWDGLLNDPDAGVPITIAALRRVVAAAKG